MNENLSQQDLTNYALNELDSHDRLYVESLLAVSEEYRNDIYGMIDVALMLEEGFERQAERTPAILLTEAQRQKLINVKVPNRFLHHTAAILSAAAAVALAFFNHDIWLPKSSATQMARVSGYVVDAVSSTDEDDLATRLANFRSLAEDPGFKKWFSAQPMNSSQGYSGSGPAISWGGFSRGASELR